MPIEQGLQQHTNHGCSFLPPLRAAWHAWADTVQGPQEERLIHDIFNGSEFIHLSRPVQEENDALVVQFSLALQQIIEVVRPHIVSAVFSLVNISSS